MTTKTETAETKTAGRQLSREYLEDKISKARAAIAFAVPGADISYAKATLIFAEIKLAAMNAAPIGSAA
jgi:hypothetical protein